MIDISYIVSAYDRPKMLRTCLWSIANQTHEQFEVIVTDNSPEPTVRAAHREVVASIGDRRFKYVLTATKIKLVICYRSAEWAVKNMARGNWLCFPCDDTYLVPRFGERMLVEAYRQNLDLVICEDVILGPDAGRGGPTDYALWTQGIRSSAKTAVLVRRSAFPGFVKTDADVTIAADQELSHEMARLGRRVGFARGVMVVHN